MPSTKEIYTPQSDAAKIARKGGVLGAGLGIVFTVVDGMQAGVEYATNNPTGETLQDVAWLLGMTAASATAAVFTPKKIDQFLHTS